MNKITLETVDGDFVSLAQIPPYKELPGVVIWGQRYFVLHSINEGRPAFRETFLAVATTLD